MLFEYCLNRQSTLPKQIVTFSIRHARRPPGRLARFPGDAEKGKICDLRLRRSAAGVGEHAGWPRSFVRALVVATPLPIFWKVVDEPLTPGLRRTLFISLAPLR